MPLCLFDPNTTIVVNVENTQIERHGMVSLWRSAKRHGSFGYVCIFSEWEEKIARVLVRWNIISKYEKLFLFV